jgi:hypothetical protein
VVPTKTQITDIVERRQDGYQVFAPAIIEVKPESVLQNRWYALAVDNIPSGVRTCLEAT